MAHRALAAPGTDSRRGEVSARWTGNGRPPFVGRNPEAIRRVSGDLLDAASGDEKTLGHDVLDVVGPHPPADVEERWRS